MEPILSKQEIADLLSTLQQREPKPAANSVSIGLADASRSEDIDLFQFHTGRHEPDKIPNFDIILELFKEYYSSALSQFLQCSVDVTGSVIEYQRFNTYLVLESHPGAIGVIKAEPLKYGGLITFSPRLSFSLIEFMLGGSPQADSVQPDRAATKIELAILKSLMVHGCNALQQALLPIVQTQTDLIKTTHDRRLISLVNPDAELIVCTFQVATEHISESMQLVFPSQAFTPYREAFENLLHLDHFETSGWFEPVSSNIKSMACTVMAQADTIDMTIKDLLDLDTGDILMFRRDPEAHLDLLVEGQAKFSGYQELRNRKRHFHITAVTE